MKPDQPNFDLIDMVQRARREHDAQAQPSQVSAVYWIEAQRKGAGKPPTPRAGHWRIDTTAQAVDAAWATLKAATEAGELGYKSKVATAGHHQADERMIHVMTYDADDTADVARVGDALRALGFADAVYERSE